MEVEVAIGSTAAISKVAISNGHCIEVVVKKLRSSYQVIVGKILYRHTSLSADFRTYTSM